MTQCWIDTETRSKTGIHDGTDKYTRDCQCTVVTWCPDDEPVRIWDAFNDPAMPLELETILHTPDIELIAHKADFDRNVIRYSLDIDTDIERWRCTMAQAYSHGLPGGLDLLGKVLGLAPEDQKLSDGRALIQFFCVPRGDDTFNSPLDFPEKWEMFLRYAGQDTHTLREIYKRMAKHNFTGPHLDVWHLDQLINQRGFGFDRKLATSAVGFLKLAKDKTDSELIKATDGVISSATQRARLLNYLREKHHVDIPNLKAAEIRAMLEQDDLHPEVRFLLETRLEAGKSSGSKYRRGLQIVGPGDRVRYAIQHAGAGRTGRSSGRGFQPHNMSRPAINTVREDGRIEQIPIKAKYIDEVVLPGIYSRQALNNPEVYGGPNEAAALAMRHVIIAAPGNELIVGDWSNIEGRINAWICGELWKIAAYEAQDAGTGKDTYKLLFSQFFGTPVDEVNDTERQGGKVVDLACGFGGSVGAVVTMAANYQMDLEPLVDIVLPRATPEQLKKAEKAWRRAFLSDEDYLLEPKVYKAVHVLVQSYREANSKLTQTRYDLDNAIHTAVKEPGRAFKVARCKIWSTGKNLIIELPSGRRLLYMNPRLETEQVEDPDTGKITKRVYLTYATTRFKRWIRERAWSGLFLENIVQAIANDILRGGLLRVHSQSLTIPAVREYLATLPRAERTAISLHVHDEVVLDLPKGLVSLELFIQWLTAGESWSGGLPLAAAGWVFPRYGKR
jgi:DNA polymerase